MEKSIIGRKTEIGRLKKYIASDRSEFIAVYGRRRVGKTFLIKELLEGQFTFRMTGKENARMADQLLNFSYAMSDFFDENNFCSLFLFFNGFGQHTECLSPILGHLIFTKEV